MARPQTVSPEARSASLQYYYKNQETALSRVKRRVNAKKTAPLPEFLAHRLVQVRARASLKGIPFELDSDWLAQQPQKCAVTGAAFVVAAKGQGPLSPAFDRIDPKQGYTKTNTQIVCCWYNQAKKHWPEPTINRLIIDAAEHFRLRKSRSQSI